MSEGKKVKMNRSAQQRLGMRRLWYIELCKVPLSPCLENKIVILNK